MADYVCRECLRDGLAVGPIYEIGRVPYRELVWIGDDLETTYPGRAEMDTDASETDGYECSNGHRSETLAGLLTDLSNL